MTEKTSQIYQEKEPKGCLSLFIRLFWMLFGNGLLILFAISIILNRATIFVDVAFWLTVTILISIRYIDIKWLKGQTSEAKPATLNDWRQYSIRLLIISTVFYALARIAANYKLL